MFAAVLNVLQFGDRDHVCQRKNSDVVSDGQLFFISKLCVLRSLGLCLSLLSETDLISLTVILK